RMISLNQLGIGFDKELQDQNPKEFDASRHNSSLIKLDSNFLFFGHKKHTCP
ncbi:34662_t:CDS:1, partial [Gigaspora margarita]